MVGVIRRSASAVRWMTVSGPRIVIAVLLTLLFPKLETLVGLLTAWCVPCVMLAGPSALMLRTTVSEHGRWSKHHALLLGATGFGIFTCLAIFSATVYEVGWATDYDWGEYFCAVVGS